MKQPWVWFLLVGLSAPPLFAQPAVPSIYGVQWDGAQLVVSAQIPAGFQNAVLESQTEAGSWQALVAGPLASQPALATFRFPAPGAFQLLRVRAGTESALPPALYSGPDYFSASNPGLSESTDLNFEEKTGHVLNRIAYGPNAPSVGAVQNLGIAGYIDQQLHPELIGESSAVAARQAALFSSFQPVDDHQLIGLESLWRYFKGTEEPPAGWNKTGFNDDRWLEGATGLGYGEPALKTVLKDMRFLNPTPASPGQPGYLTVYLRKAFYLSDPNQVDQLILRVDYDDGFVAYLNGVEVARGNVRGNPPLHTQTALANHEAGAPEEFSLTPKKSLLQPGENVLAIQVHNVSLNSADLVLRPELIARRPLPTPPLRRIKGITELQQLMHLRGVYSQRQLQSVLAEFWQNHFTTDYNKDAEYLQALKNSDGTDAMSPGQAALEAAQNSLAEFQFFSDHALGNFGDLLLFSATSPSMLVYLDTVLNVKGTPNENYAREIFELFSFGVDNRYTQKDIEQLAKCFTGWTMRKVRPNEKLAFPDSARQPPVVPPAEATEKAVVDFGPGWKYFKGTREPAPDASQSPTADWTQLGFDDSAWLSGATSFGYGRNDDATRLSDMRSHYLSLYLRRTFTLDIDPAQFENLVLSVAYAHGCVAYLNGVEIARSESMFETGTPPAFNAAAKASHQVTAPPDLFSLREFAGLLRPAPEINVLAIQAHNVSLGSAVFSIRPRLLLRQKPAGLLENGDHNGVWTFWFEPSHHDTSAKTLWEGTPFELHIPAGRTAAAGVQDALDVIDAIVRHPSSSEFICLKLINKLVSDEISLASYRDGTAPEGLRRLMDSALAAWRSTEPQGNIRAVMRAILDPQQQSNFFWSRRAYRSKIKTPIEFINSSARALEAELAGTDLPAFNEKLGMHLFTRMEPNGWSELGKDWMDTGTLLERVKFSQTLAGNLDAGARWQPATFFRQHQLATAEAVVHYFNHLLYDGSLSPPERGVLVRFALTDTNGNVRPLDPKKSDFLPRLQDLVSLMLSLPEWNYQ